MIVSRLLALTLGLAVLTSCARQEMADQRVDLGDFRLGLTVVVTDNMQKVPISRDATGEEWEAALTRALLDRFGSYEGDKFYNIGVAVDGYALAPPGIPIVASPKSILVVSLSVFDDAAGAMLNEGGKGIQISAFEEVSGGTIVGSGLTRTREEQMESLAYVAAKRIEDHLRENGKWFGLTNRRQETPADFR